MRFAEAVRSQVTPGSMVWVQDYHLMLLPMMLRGLVDGSAGGEWQKRELSKITEGIEESFATDKEKVPGVKIGFFLHTPFPSSEIYRCVRRVVLRLDRVLMSCVIKDSPGAARDPAWDSVLRSYWVPHV